MLREGEAPIVASEGHDDVEFRKREVSVDVNFVNPPLFVEYIKVAADELLAPPAWHEADVEYLQSLLGFLDAFQIESIEFGGFAGDGHDDTLVIDGRRIDVEVEEGEYLLLLGFVGDAVAVDCLEMVQVTVGRVELGVANHLEDHVGRLPVDGQNMVGEAHQKILFEYFHFTLDVNLRFILGNYGAVSVGMSDDIPHDGVALPDGWAFGQGRTAAGIVIGPCVCRE